MTGFPDTVDTPTAAARSADGSVLVAGRLNAAGRLYLRSARDAAIGPDPVPDRQSSHDLACPPPISLPSNGAQLLAAAQKPHCTVRLRRATDRGAAGPTSPAGSRPDSSTGHDGLRLLIGVGCREPRRADRRLSEVVCR